jgi:hypothetical protein
VYLCALGENMERFYNHIKLLYPNLFFKKKIFFFIHSPLFIFLNLSFFSIGEVEKEIGKVEIEVGLSVGMDAVWFHNHKPHHLYSLVKL